MKLFARNICIILGATLPVIASAQVQLNNPLGSDVNSIDDVLSNIVMVFLGIIGGVALFVLVYGGTLMLISGGNPEKVKKGQSAMSWAVIGLLLIFGSYGITQFIFQLIGG